MTALPLVSLTSPAQPLHATHAGSFSAEEAGGDFKNHLDDAQQPAKAEKPSAQAKTPSLEEDAPAAPAAQDAPTTPPEATPPQNATAVDAALTADAAAYWPGLLMVVAPNPAPNSAPNPAHESTGGFSDTPPLATLQPQPSPIEQAPTLNLQPFTALNQIPVESAVLNPAASEPSLGQPLAVLQALANAKKPAPTADMPVPTDMPASAIPKGLIATAEPPLSVLLPAQADALTPAAPAASLAPLLAAGLKAANEGDTLKTDALNAAPMAAPETPAQASAGGDFVGTAVSFTATPALPPVYDKIHLPMTLAFGHAQWTENLAERTGWLIEHAIKTADIQLDPPELGPIAVKIHLQQDQISVSFMAPNASVKEAIDHSMARLKELLQEQGIQLAHADVGHQQHSSQQQRPDDPQATGAALNAPEAEPQSHIQLTAAASHRIDYFA